MKFRIALAVASFLPRCPQWTAWLMAGGLLMAGKAAGQGGTPPYLDAGLPVEIRVADLISRMTLQEKATQLYHRGSVNERLQIPNYGGWNQCLHGVWSPQRTTLFPVSIAAAATWDPDLIRAEADAISDEGRALFHMGAQGINGPHGLIYRAPVINISRNPFWGRIQECYGEDPWLTSRIGVAYLQGLQGDDPKYLKVAGTLKHFAVNNVETGRLTYNATVPERWLHEYWLPHWKACAIEGKAQSIMAAYNLINGTHCAVDSNLLTDILRDRWGYKGFVVSDLGGIGHMINRDFIFPDAPTASAAAIVAGCDYDDVEYRDGIAAAVTGGLLPEAAVDQALSRVLDTAFKLGVFDPPSLVPYSTIDPSVIRSQEHQDLSLEVARASMVLLKNQGGFLPLDKSALTNIAVIGPLADAFVKGNYYEGPVTNPITPLQGLINRADPGTQVVYAKGCGVSTASTGGERTEALQAAAAAEKVVMCLGTDASIEGEARDRTYLELSAAQQDLLQAVHAVNPNIVLVLVNAGPLSIPWADANVPSIIEAWWAGEKGGNAIADVIFGDVNPGGKLPYTVYPSSTDPGLPSQHEYDVSQGFTYMFFPNQALYPFGHGLSYTTFGYSNLQQSIHIATPDRLVRLSIDVQNTGGVAGDEVVQVYIRNRATSVVQASRKLVAFKKVRLDPGETRNLELSVSVDQLGYYDEAVHDFVTASGEYDLMVGSSSADIRLNDVIHLSVPPVILPGTPGGLSAVIHGPGHVSLEWNKASRADTYTVKRSLNEAGPFDAIVASGLVATSFVDPDPVEGVRNHYLVIAGNPAGESEPSQTASVLAVEFVAPPAPPTDLNAVVNGGAVTLGWTAPTGADSYLVQRSVKSTGPFETVVADLTNPGFVDALPSSSLSWFYRVSAINAGGSSLPAGVTAKLSQGPPAPWLQADVGGVGLTGGMAFDDGKFTIQGAGATIWNNADAFHFVYFPLNGDGTLTVRVESMMVTSDLNDGWEKGGLMIRETLAAGSKHCMAVMTTGQGASFHWRDATGGATARTTTAGLASPRWVRLTRAGDTFTARQSADGVAWTQIGAPRTNVMASSVYAGLALSSHNTGVLNTSSFDSFSLTAAPPAPPAGLSATVNGGEVTLNWTARPDADGYAVKRSNKSTGAFTTMAEGLAAPGFVDTPPISSLTYYYEVRASNAAGEGSPATASAKLAAPPPSPWLEADVGNVGQAGGSAVADGKFTIQGAGGSIWAAADAFHFVYVPLTGDGTLVVRVADMMVTSDVNDGWEKGGVMIRETLAANSKHCMAMMTTGNGVSFHWRTATGGATARTSTAGLVPPRWVKLTRSGDLFTAHQSADGIAWTQIGTQQSNVMAATVYAGLALTSHNTAMLNTSTFDAFSLTVPGIGTPGGLAATAGNGEVMLAWNPVAEAIAYNVKRATVGGGPYAMTAAGVTANEYTDTGLNNGTTYFYVVTATTGVAEGDASLQAEAMPVSPPITDEELRAPEIQLESNGEGGRNGVVTVIESVIGHHYQLQFSGNLMEGTWQDIGAPLPGTGAGLPFVVPLEASHSRGFFRIAILP